MYQPPRGGAPCENRMLARRDSGAFDNTHILDTTEDSVT